MGCTDERSDGEERPQHRRIRPSHNNYQDDEESIDEEEEFKDFEELGSKNII